MSVFLHLSDLHLGEVNENDIPDDFKSDIVPIAERTKRQDILKRSLSQLALHLKQKGTQLDAIIVSGDITVANNEIGFQKFDEILTSLGEARPAPQRIVVVPGNHDVEWAAPTHEDHYRNFLKYIRERGFVTPLLEGIDPFKEAELAKHDITKHRIIGPGKRWAIIPVNSSHYCGSLEPLGIITEAAWNLLPQEIVRLQGRGEPGQIEKRLRRLRLQDIARITPQQLDGISFICKSVREPGEAGQRAPMLFLVLHHHLLPVTVREEFKAFESITNLGHLRYAIRDNAVSAVFHGHKHASYYYFDYIHASERPDLDSPHRALVVSAPAVEAPGGQAKSLARLVQIGGTENAPTLTLTDIPTVDHGFTLALPEGISTPVWQMDSPTAPLKACFVHGQTIDEVYERSLGLFEKNKTKTLAGTLVCQIMSSPTPDTLPKAYPEIPGETNKAAWFASIVSWWQKERFTKLSSVDQFNHGTRINRQRPMGQKGADQISNVIKAIGDSAKTTRGIITLLNPEEDGIETDKRFPSFCMAQFLVREEGAVCFLELIAYFRKQEMKYWWPVNVAELSRLQQRIVAETATAVQEKLRKPLQKGGITTISAMAEIGDKVPNILVPAIDIDLEEHSQELWNMTYAICWKEIPGRQEYSKKWESVLARLIPPPRQDPLGVPVPIQGLAYLADISEHFGQNHPGEAQSLAKELRELCLINRRHANDMAGSKLSEERHADWRRQVLGRLNAVRGIINNSFGVTINEFQ